MKKFKKIIAMGCAAVMAMSVMSISAFASEQNEATFTVTDNSGNQKVVTMNVDIPNDATEDELQYQILQYAKEAAGIEEVSVASAEYPGFDSDPNVVLRANPFTINLNETNYSQTKLGSFVLPSNTNRLTIGIFGIGDTDSKINVRLHDYTLYGAGSTTNIGNDPYQVNVSVDINDYYASITFINGRYYGSTGDTHRTKLIANHKYEVFASAEGQSATAEKAAVWYNY